MNINGLEFLNNELEIIDESKVREYCSIFGSSGFEITEEHINALKNGKVLCGKDNEYTIFITMGK